MMDEQKLLQMKREIEQAKGKLAELKGQKKALMQQLKETWKCNSLDEASTKLDEMEKESEKLSDNINDMLEELEKKYKTQ